MSSERKASIYKHIAFTALYVYVAYEFIKGLNG